MILAVGNGCSGGGNTLPVIPEAAQKTASTDANHYTWGLWQFKADPSNSTLDVVQLRTGSFHLNALPFLEPPPLAYLSLESLQFNGNIVDADIGLRHPFLGLVEFTGFDVCGTLITNGSVTGFNDPGIVMAGEGDTRLLNPDGFSRWWNPTEFPVNAGNIFCYKDGLLGTPDDMADYNSTLNAYKYFCNDLVDPDDPLSDVTLQSRGMFGAGQKNIRHYSIELGQGLIFNYAVDACWQFPDGGAPWEVPDDFAPGANRAEPWRIEVTEADNTLYNDGEISGGSLNLLIDAYDWFNADSNMVRVESPGNFTMVESTTIVGGGEGYSTYEVDIANTTPDPGSIDLLISLVSDEADFGGFLPGINTTAYFTYTAEVGGETPTKYHWEFDSGGLIYDVSLHDDMSPCLAWETDDQLRCYWTSDSISSYYAHPHGQSQSMRSDDGGTTWFDFHQWWGHGNDGCGDHAKIMAADNGDSYALHPLARPGGVYSLPHYYAGASNDMSFGHSWAFTMLPYEDHPELICAADGYLHVFGDRDGGYLSGIKQQICNQKYTFENDWTGWPDPENIPWPEMWWPLDKHDVVAPPAHISNTRSIADDLNGTIYMAFWGGVGYDFIKVARSTDAEVGLTWDILPIFQASGFSDVRDPGLDIDANGTIHISFLRHNNSTDEDEVCYTYSTDDGDNWSPVVAVYSTVNKLTDTPVEAYEVLDAYVVAITFEENDAVYLVSSFNAGVDWEEPVLVSYGGGESDKQPDMMLGTDDKLHFAFSHMDVTDRDIHYRNAWLVEN